MYLAKLAITNVRNLTKIQLECSSGINIIAGKNAAGKTAILESIHVLARVSSFRTPRITDVIQHGKNSLAVMAHIDNPGSVAVITGIEKSKQNTQLKFNGNKVLKRSEQVRNLPVITITAESHRLLYGSPRERRHWLDWSMFHVEPAYMQDWQSYHHALRQRNALLRTFSSNDQYDVWESVLAKYTVRLRSARGAYVDELKRFLAPMHNGEFSGQTIKLLTAPEGEEAIKNRLAQQRKNDMTMGHTQYGPHREDVLFQTSGQDSGKTLSRGEGKRLIIFLLASQAKVQKSKNGHCPILLIDDLPAELDEIARGKIMSTLMEQGPQLFVTTTDAKLIDIGNKPGKQFHMEHGKLMKVLE